MNRAHKLFLGSATVLFSLSANAGISIIDNERGNFAIAGNVELNFNYRDRESNVSGDQEFNQDGRVLVEFAGEKYSNHDYFVGVKAQPLFESTGNVVLDDAYFEFGKKDGWAVKAGRFEAADMFPVGLDVFLEYSGDTANDLYTDGWAYTYQMKEARGRGADGQLMYHQTFDNLYIEVGSMMGDRSNLFRDGIDGSYHGHEIDKSKDSFLIRPLIAYSLGQFRFSAAMETNLVSNSVVANGVDISQRTGYGLTGNWSNENWSINVNVAYLDAVDETNFSSGINMVWDNVGIGYVYADNEYNNKELSGWVDGNVEVATIYASYAFRDTLDIKDFSILLGSYYTAISSKLTQSLPNEYFKEDDDYGMRVRLYYAF
ncbi:carbohydrate porin [Vibrio olivae]|uniref:Carbohydrate porin n=1 Tax=Vibrio olivae TaxID=1243002 RepID=A0ABV5HRQ4_9VIBR